MVQFHDVDFTAANIAQFMDALREFCLHLPSGYIIIYNVGKKRQLDRKARICMGKGFAELEAEFLAQGNYHGVVIILPTVIQRMTIKGIMLVVRSKVKILMASTEQEALRKANVLFPA